jgi:hypothetical protein
MTTDLLEQRLHDLAVPTPDAGRVSARVLATQPSRHQRRAIRIAAAPVALIVLAALVAYFVPAADTALADVPFAGDLLRSAGLVGARDRITSVGSSATSSGYTITLVGAYADSTRTVLLLRSDPPSLPAGGFDISLTDQFARTYQLHGGTTNMLTGEATIEFDALAWPDALTGARITLHVKSVQAIGPGPDFKSRGVVRGEWNLAATIGVDEASPLPLPAPAATGSIHYRFTSVTYTPATIVIDMFVTGTTAQEMNTRIPDGRKGTPEFTMAVQEPNGDVMNTWLLGEQEQQGVRVHYLFYRSGGSGEYVLRFNYVGQGGFQRVLSIP